MPQCEAEIQAYYKLEVLDWGHISTFYILPLRLYPFFLPFPRQIPLRRAPLAFIDPWQPVRFWSADNPVRHSGAVKTRTAAYSFAAIDSGVGFCEAAGYKAMIEYVDLPLNKKLNLLRAHSLGCDWPNLDQEHWCLHCEQKFNGHSVRVWQDDDGGLWLECGTPDCDGSPIDWAPYPWWDEDHPATKAYLKKQKKPGRKSRRKPADDDDDCPF